MEWLVWLIIGIIVIGAIGVRIGKSKERKTRAEMPKLHNKEENSAMVEVRSDPGSMELDSRYASSTRNPFGAVIQKSTNKLTTIQWTFPYFPQLIEVSVLIVAIATTTILYMSIGVAAQIEATLRKLMLDTRNEMKSAGLIEKSAYALLAGIYIIFWLPFELVLLPFQILGLIWNKLGFAGLVFVLAAVIVFVLFYTGNLSQDMFHIKSISSWYNHASEPNR